MDGKKYIICELVEIPLIYGKPLTLTEVETMFNKIRIEYLGKFENLTVEFDEWEGNREQGFDPVARATFYGERLETDEEYQKRLIYEEKQRLIKIKLDKEEAEREKIRQDHQKDFDRQTFEKLKEKYGW